MLAIHQMLGLSPQLSALANKVLLIKLATPKQDKKGIAVLTYFLILSFASTRERFNLQA